MGTDGIYNFIRIDDRVATSGQPTAAQMAAARDEGIRVVVNLAPTGEVTGVLDDEAETVRSLGMEYHHLPIPWDDPRPEHFDAFAEIMDGVAEDKVLVHCAANYRVTAFYALYAMRRDGWSEACADELMTRIWGDDPTQRMDDAWRRFVLAVRGR
jgi:uncharacterized protein (TIGR01244 family)